MLVLIGAQGKGKSRLVRWICPLPKLFTEGPISPDNKDDHIKAMNFMVWEVAELDATTRKADRSALKNFISQQEITVRVPYGRYPIIKPAACSFIGTVNPDGTGFLSDPSGNRRFAVIEMDNIDWSYEQIDRDQLWAQMYEAYKAGETWELTLHEKEIQNQINSEHTAVSNLEEMLLRHYELDPSDESKFETGMDILQKLEMEGLQGQQCSLLFELGGIMTKHGIAKKQRRVGGVKAWAYLGVKPMGLRINV
jgi:predicted P-loop ATPase